MVAAGATVFYNLKLRHPTLDLPITDYDLVLLFHQGRRDLEERDLIEEGGCSEVGVKRGARRFYMPSSQNQHSFEMETKERNINLSLVDLEKKISENQVGGLLGLGGGFIVGPLFLELGIPPRVYLISIAYTTQDAEIYSSEYALYLVAVATVAALVGQHREKTGSIGESIPDYLHLDIYNLWGLYIRLDYENKEP
ncbi:hypothetical protein MLD38_029447 [Melastoma candidum]|uniref:Uncharacterized protein n=1 Tax=Melastoma candidum TaxID=119954 RepID=A0ACB9N3R5_9MYRT|nr:hypothetical protein MLD38_029447 [Melastoma candidum]